MTLSITFNGTNISKWLDGILLVTRNVGQNRVPQLDQVGRSDGKMFSYIRADEGTITVTAIVRTDVNKKRRLLADALTTSTPAKLVFADEPDIYYNAISTGQITLDEAYLHNTMTITFTVPDGIAHSVATQTADNMPYKDVPVNFVIASHASGSNTTILDLDIVTMNLSEDLSGKTITTSVKVIVTNYKGKIDPKDSSDPHVDTRDGYDTGVWTSLSNPINVTGNGVYTSVPKTMKKSPLTGKNNRIYVHMYNLNATIEVWVKVELGTTASPWSPNPADPEYYTNTITVHNGGTYPVEPVITATINGDDGVLTAINDQGSVLQFGSPDETDGFVKQKSERVYH
ncbi:phage tail protein, partial [Lacticaseibacillus paracasei]